MNGCKSKLTPTEQLSLAISSGDETKAIAILHKHPELTGTQVYPKTQTTVLHLAAEEDMPDLIHELIKLGAAIEVKDGIYHTPLITAAERGNTMAIEALIQEGADIEASSWDGSSEETKALALTPLGAAVGRYELEAATLLVAHGASLEVPTGFWPILHNACTRTTLPATPEKAKKLVYLWKTWGGSLNDVGLAGQTPLEHAKAMGAKPMVDALEAAINENVGLSKNSAEPEQAPTK